jgi:hypothetical protein
MAERAVFVDHRDMPGKLYPYQFIVNGRFMSSLDGREVPLEIRVEITEQEANIARRKASFADVILANVRMSIVRQVDKHIECDVVMAQATKTIIAQINGKLQVVEPPKKEEHDAAS